ncbi:hypothetical protein BK390_12880 [Escherichia coli]|nr:hypothetical protein BK390_12880 [Escherichia coli]
MPCFTAVRAEIALMSGSAFAVTHHAFSSGAGRTADRNRSHWSTSKTPSYTKSVSWQHHPILNIVPASLEQELLAKDIFVINIQNVKMVKNLTFGERIFFHV